MLLCQAALAQFFIICNFEFLYIFIYLLIYFRPEVIMLVWQTIREATSRLSGSTTK